MNKKINKFLFSRRVEIEILKFPLLFFTKRLLLLQLLQSVYSSGNLRWICCFLKIQKGKLVTFHNNIVTQTVLYCTVCVFVKSFCCY